MSFEGAGEVVRDLYEALAARAFEDAATQVHGHVDLITISTGDVYYGLSGFMEYYRGWVAALPDLRLGSIQYGGSEKRTSVEYEMAGTQTGPLLMPHGHIPPTGREIHLRVCDVVEVADGKVTHIRTYFDMVTLLRQLGVVAGTPLHAPDRRAPLEMYAQAMDANAPERHKAIVHRFIQDVYSRRDPGAAGDSCDSSIVRHGGPLGDAQGLAEYKGFLTSLFVGLPDLEVQILDTIAEADRVVVRLSVGGTHLGPYREIPPTYKRVMGG